MTELKASPSRWRTLNPRARHWLIGIASAVVFVAVNYASYRYSMSREIALKEHRISNVDMAAVVLRMIALESIAAFAVALGVSIVGKVKTGSSYGKAWNLVIAWTVLLLAGTLAFFLIIDNLV